MSNIASITEFSYAYIRMFLAINTIFLAKCSLDSLLIDSVLHLSIKFYQFPGDSMLCS